MTDIETILYSDMKRIAIKICKGNVYDAEDLVQDLAVRVYGNLDFYLNRTYAHLKSLIYHQLEILRIYNYKFYSAQKRTPPAHYEPKVVDNDVWGLMQKRDLQTLLSEVCNNMFRLKLDGYKAAEISNMTGYTVDTVNKYISNTKLYLIKQLKAA